MILCAIHYTGLAQLNENRSTSTKIADLLAIQPAENQERLTDAMQQLAQFTAADLSTLLQQLKPQGAPENIPIQYAVNSYSFQVRSLKNEARLQTFNEGVLDALNKTKDPDNARFLIGILRPAANDRVIPALSVYLSEPAYSQPAADVLGEIGSDAAGQALLDALQNTQDAQIAISLINTLGRMAYAPAEKTILSKVGSGNPELQKTILASLARIAGRDSEALLAKAAKEVGYSYEHSGATAALLDYAGNLLDKGETTAALHISAQVFKTKNLPPAVKARTLRLLVAIEGEKQINNLLKGAKDTDPAYRQTSLTLLSRFKNEQNTGKLTKNLFKEPEGVQISILQYLGNEAQHTALPVVQEALYKGGDPVNAAAAVALYQLMGDGSVPLLLPLLSRNGQATTGAIHKILLSSAGPGLEQQLIQQLGQETNETAQVNLLNILGERHFGKSGSLVLQLAGDHGSDKVRDAAYHALPNVVRAESVPGLLDLLAVEGTAQQQINALQRAIITAIQNSPDPKVQKTQLIQKFNQEPDRIKQRYFPVLSGVADEQMLEIVKRTAFEHDEPAMRHQAIVSLSSWRTADAIPALIQLNRLQNRDSGASGETAENAINQGLVRLIGQSDFPAEQKVLLLRDLFENVTSPDHQKQILRALEATKTYNAMLFAGRFLNDGALKSVAANTVMGIALDNNQYYGQEVVDLLEKVSGVLSGSESSYLREAIRKHIAALPKDPGYVSLFNGENLEGWKGLVANPIKRAAMDAQTLATEQVKADETMRGGWYVADGVLHFNGKGDNIATVKQYGNFEMLVDWKLAADGKEGDAGIYLRGTPQVQVWDTSRVNVGAQVGSGGLYNNQVHPSKPLLVADNALGEWNTFRIRMIDDRVTVYLNGHLVTDNVVLENYWDRRQPIFPVEQIELQAHGTHVSYRDIYIKELPGTSFFELSEEEKTDGFTVLFDGSDMDHWTGNTADYIISPENTLAVYPKQGSGGNLYTKEEFGDFIFRFSFRLTPGANNGVGIRTPMEGDAAYVGMEIQVLDNGAAIYKDLKDWQYHGSVYGIIAAKRGFLKPVGEWNEEEIYIRGDHIRVTLNGTVIVDGNLKEATKNGTLDGHDHPGLKNSRGHIGFLGHGSEVHFKDMRIKRL